MHLTLGPTPARTDTAAAAALAGAWLLDVLRGAGCELGCDVATDLAADGEARVIVTVPDADRARVERAVDRALAEPRFVGWRLLDTGSGDPR